MPCCSSPGKVIQAHSRKQSPGGVCEEGWRQEGPRDAEGVVLKRGPRETRLEKQRPGLASSPTEDLGSHMRRLDLIPNSKQPLKRGPILQEQTVLQKDAVAAVCRRGCGRAWRRQAGAQGGGSLHGPGQTRDGFWDGDGCCLRRSLLRV